METTVATTINRVTSALLSVNKVYLKLAFESCGMEPIRFAEDVLVPVLDRIGERWQNGDLSLAQVYMSGRLSENLMDEVLVSGSRPLRGNLPLAIAVLEDFHVLGKRIVSSVLRAGGFDFVDYGPIKLDSLVDRVREDGIKVLLISTLMLASALRVKQLRERLEQLGLHVTLIVGGAPFRFDPSLWREVGADATCATASGVIRILGTLTAEDDHGNA